MGKQMPAPCAQGERSTCVISEDRTTIMFLPCGVISFNANDVRERYCGHCHRFMETEIGLRHAS
jgi:hypothetical protein